MASILWSHPSDEAHHSIRMSLRFMFLEAVYPQLRASTVCGRDNWTAIPSTSPTRKLRLSWPAQKRPKPTTTVESHRYACDFLLKPHRGICFLTASSGRPLIIRYGRRRMAYSSFEAGEAYFNLCHSARPFHREGWRRRPFVVSSRTTIEDA